MRGGREREREGESTYVNIRNKHGVLIRESETTTSGYVRLQSEEREQEKETEGESTYVYIRNTNDL